MLNKYTFMLFRKIILLSFIYYSCFFVLFLYSQSPIFAQQMPALIIKNGAVATGGKVPTLQIDKLQIQVEVTANIAQTTMEMTFYNDTYQVLEGELFFPLAEGQNISRFAMEIDGHLREGVVVEKNKGRKIFEDIVRRGIDPALLEYTKGNAFRARIYPINPKSYKRIVVAYKEILDLTPQGFQYHLPLKYSSPLRKFLVRVAAENPIQFTPNSLLKDLVKQSVFETEKNNFIPNQALSFTIPTKNGSSNFAMSRGVIQADYSYFYVHLQPSIQQQAKTLPKKLTVFFDISNSAQNRAIKTEIEILKKYIQKIQNIDLQIIIFNTAIRRNEVFEISNGDFSEVEKLLTKQNFDGGTQLACLDLTQYNTEEFWLISDGVSNFGRHEIILPNNTPNSPSTPIYTLNTSAIAEHSYLRFLAETTGGVYLNLTAMSPTKAQELLWQQPFQLLKASLLDKKGKQLVDNVVLTPSKPTTINGDFVLAGKIPYQANDQEFSLKMDFGFGNVVTHSKVMALTYSPNKDRLQGMTENLWASLKINELDLQFKTHEKEILDLSTTFNIVSRNTSLLVLDRLEDYRTYNIQPPAALLAQHPDFQWKTTKTTEQKRIVSKQTIQQLIAHKEWYNTTFLPKYPDDETISRVPENESDLMEEEKAMGFGESDDGWADDPWGDSAASTSPLAPPKIQTLRFMPPEPVPDEEVPTEEVTPESKITPQKQPTAKKTPEETATVSLQPYVATTFYLRKLDSLVQLKSEEKLGLNGIFYKNYLQLKKQYKNNLSFYSDVALWFLAQKDTATAVLVASNLAEMQLENHEVLRLLASVLKQSRQTEAVIATYEDVLAIRDEEPQSFRDLGLAYAANNEPVKALSLLNEVLVKEWDSRFEGIEGIVINEINHIINQPTNLTTEDILQKVKLDKRILHPTSYDLRVVLEWDNENYDMDLMIVQPNGEVAYKDYTHDFENTQVGGKIAKADLPEEFLLKKAINGNYEIFVNYKGSTSQKLPAAANVTVNIFTNYGRKNEKVERIHLRFDKERTLLKVGKVVINNTESPKSSGLPYEVLTFWDNEGNKTAVQNHVFTANKQTAILQTQEEIVFLDIHKKLITNRLAVPLTTYLTDTTKTYLRWRNINLFTNEKQEQFLQTHVDSLVENLVVDEKAPENSLATYSFVRVYELKKIAPPIAPPHKEGSNDTVASIKPLPNGEGLGWGKMSINLLQNVLLYSKVPTTKTITETDEEGNFGEENSTYTTTEMVEKGQPFSLCAGQNLVWQDHKMVAIQNKNLEQIADFSALQSSKTFTSTPHFLPKVIVLDCATVDSTKNMVTDNYLRLYDYKGKELGGVNHHLSFTVEKLLPYGDSACWVFANFSDKSIDYKETLLYFWSWSKENNIFREIDVVPAHESADWISEDGKFLVTKTLKKYVAFEEPLITRLYDLENKTLIFQTFRSDLVVSPDSTLLLQFAHSQEVGEEVRLRSIAELPKATNGAFIAQDNKYNALPVFDTKDDEIAYLSDNKLFIGKADPLLKKQQAVTQFNVRGNSDAFRDLLYYQKGEGKKADKAIIALKYKMLPTGLLEDGEGIYVYAHQNATEMEHWAKHYNFVPLDTENKNITKVLSQSKQGRYVAFLQDSVLDTQRFFIVKILDTDVLAKRQKEYTTIKNFTFYNYIAVKTVFIATQLSVEKQELLFSPDETKLYFFASDSLWQIDLTAKPYQVKYAVKIENVASNLLIDQQERIWFLTSPPTPLSIERGGVGTSQEPITKDKLHLVILPLQNLEKKLNSEATKVPPLQMERGLGGEVNIALSEDEKLLAIFGTKENNSLQVYETQEFRQVALFFDQRPFRKVKFSSDNRYVIGNNGFSKGADYLLYNEYYDDMGSSIKAWELPQNATKTSISKKLSTIDTITYNPIFAKMAVPYDDIDDYAEGLARIKKGTLFGYADSVENVTIPIQYDEATHFKNGLAVVRQNGKYGVIDKKGKEILPLLYTNITVTPAHTLIVRKNEKVGLFDFSGKSVLPIEYSLLSYVVDDLYAFKEYDSSANSRKLQGILNKKGKIIQQPQYGSMRDFANGFTIVWTPAKPSFGAINRKGEVIIPNQYADLQYFTNKNYPFLRAEQTVLLPNKKAVHLFGVIDSLGKIVLPISYEAIGDFGKGIAQITKKGKVGLIDSTMKIILPSDYQAIGKLSDNFLWVKQNNQYGFVDITGKIVIAPQYAQVTDFEAGTALVKQHKHWYRINTQNQKIIAKVKNYQSIETFDNGVAKVRMNNLVGLIDQTGTETVVPIYSLIGEFRSGLALVQFQGKFGYINAKGEEIVPTVYTEIQAFKEGMARFKRDTVSGYLNLQGVEVIKSAAFGNLQDFENGLAIVLKDDKYGCVDKTGKVVMPFVYDELRGFSEGLAAAQRNGKWIFVNSNGKQAFQGEFDTVMSFADGLAKVNARGREFFIDKMGNCRLYCR